MVSLPPSDTDSGQLAPWADELDLPVAVVQALCRHYTPLSAWLGERKKALGRPLIVGVNGAQGTGKSTLLALLLRLLGQKRAGSQGLRVAGLSLDDLYLTAQQRAALADSVHPLLRTRGVPGTHDLSLAHEVLDVLTRGDTGRYALPLFDKALDDRAQASSWPQVEVPCDVVVLEGWCVGARPQAAEAITAPVNDLERQDDADARWRTYVNEQLRGPYAELFARLDVLVMLKAPDMACVRRWRIEQERALSRRLRREGRPDTTLDAGSVERFVQFFERLTTAMLEEMPARADVLFELDRDHQITSAHYRQAPPHASETSA